MWPIGRRRIIIHYKIKNKKSFQSNFLPSFSFTIIVEWTELVHNHIQTTMLNKTLFYMIYNLYYTHKLEAELLQKIQQFDSIWFMMLPFSTSTLLLCLFHRWTAKLLDWIFLSFESNHLEWISSLGPTKRLWILVQSTG